MYILPTPTHLEVVALGGSSAIFFFDILIMNRTAQQTVRVDCWAQWPAAL